jgi:hypothetical protein
MYARLRLGEQVLKGRWRSFDPCADRGSEPASVDAGDAGVARALYGVPERPECAAA